MCEDLRMVILIEASRFLEWALMLHRVSWEYGKEAKDRNRWVGNCDTKIALLLCGSKKLFFYFAFLMFFYPVGLMYIFF